MTNDSQYFKPLVTVVVTSYNQKELLIRAVDSALAQTYTNLEILIVDDHSTDGSDIVILEYTQQFPDKVTYFIQPTNVKIAKNKNTGFKLAKGDFITYLDGDDTYYPEKISKEMTIFSEHPEYSVVYSGYDFKDVKGEVYNVWHAEQMPEGYIFKELVTENFPHNYNPRFELYKKHVLQELNYYDESFLIYEDLDFMMRYSTKYLCGYSGVVGASYWQNPNSIVSSSKRWVLTQQHKKAFLKNKSLFDLSTDTQQFYKEYMSKFNTNLLFTKTELSIFDYIKAFINRPYDIYTILKAYNYRRKTKL